MKFQQNFCSMKFTLSKVWPRHLPQRWTWSWVWLLMAVWESVCLKAWTDCLNSRFQSICPLRESFIWPCSPDWVDKLQGQSTRSLKGSNTEITMSLPRKQSTSFRYFRKITRFMLSGAISMEAGIQLQSLLSSNIPLCQKLSSFFLILRKKWFCH